MRIGRTQRRRRWRGGLDAVASISMIVAAVVLLMNARGPRSPGTTGSAAIRLPTDPVALDGLPTKGNPGASVGLILYSDFQCPFCRRFAIDVLPIVERDLIDTGQLLLAFEHMPLEAILPNALAAATLAECGNRQGAFWTVHDRLFAESRLSAPAISTLAREMGFAEDSTCLTSDGIAKVRREQSLGKALGIISTPSFLLGTIEAAGRLRIRRALTGLQSAETIASAVRALREGAE